MTSTLAFDAGAAAPGAADIARLHSVIDDLQGGCIADGQDAAAYDAMLSEIERAIRRMGSYKLQVIAKADAARVADRSGLANTSSWLARRTHADAAQAARDVRLATALETPEADEPRPCAKALATGAVSAAHAQVIVNATGQLPSGLTFAAVETVERDLVDKALHLSPDQLRRVARRALAAVEDDQAALDRHEDALLRSEEDAAYARTRLSLHDNGDGTTSGHFTVPTVAASILTRAIHSMTSPRRAALGASTAQAGEPEERLDWARRSGQAFVELLEHLPTDHLHGKVAATVVVTMELDRLRAAVGAAGIDTGDSMSAGDLRRIACNAGIVPAVLKGASLPLDLGRSSRLFSEAQRVALATTQSTCAADGCDRSISWCELHHQEHWDDGGNSDLGNAIGLCGFHHRRIHDPKYEHQYGPGGVVFSARTR